MSSVKISDEYVSELLKWLPAALHDALIKGDHLENPDAHHDLVCFMDIFENLFENRILRANYLIDATVWKSQYQE